MDESWTKTNSIVDKFELRRDVKGSLSNKSFLVKDLIDIEGKVTGLGNPWWASTHEPSSCNAKVVEQMLDAGAICLGKSVTDEFAISLDGLNQHFAIPLNPLYKDRIPGGSSSGSASAVACKLVDFALGTDTVGSIRAPGAFCGIWAMRPSHAFVPLNGVYPLGPSFDTVGWLSRQPDLLLEIGKVLIDKRIEKRKIKSYEIVTSSSLFSLAEKEHGDSLFKLSKSPGAEIQDIKFDTRLLDIWSQVFSVMRSYEAWQFYGDWIESNQEKISHTALCRLKEGKDVQKEEYEHAQKIKNLAHEYMANKLGTNRFLCMPTTIGLPALLKSSEEELSALRKRNIRLLIIAAISGLPQISFPVKLPDGNIYSLSLLGPKFSDLELIEKAILLEQHLQLN